jgi:hypothetical protein
MSKAPIQRRLVAILAADVVGYARLIEQDETTTLAELKVRWNEVVEPLVVWLSLSCSGNETAAHLAETDRMTVMFCAFGGEAMILCVCGHAKVVHPRDQTWNELARLFQPMAGSRQILDLEIDLVQTACGSRRAAHGL